MFGADALFKRTDARDRRQKSEQTNCLLSNLMQRRKFQSIFLYFRSKGLVFSLTNEGHIEVSKTIEIISFCLPKFQRMFLHQEKIHEILLAYHKVAHHKLNNFQLIL
jgi:hypothetical protein